jgi:Mn-dependent DtxR family transcriptional regulator
MPVSGEHHPAFEEYCECIFELQEDDVDVIQARIVERLGVSRPAVSEMIRRLETEQLIAVEANTIRLTTTAWQSASSPTCSASPGLRPTTRQAAGST